MLINRCNVGSDGKTPYERLRGKKFERRLCTFGECVLALRNSKAFENADDKRMNKLDSRWFDGVYVGVRVSSGETIVSTSPRLEERVMLPVRLKP